MAGMEMGMAVMEGDGGGDDERRHRGMLDGILHSGRNEDEIGFYGRAGDCGCLWEEGWGWEGNFWTPS